MDALLTPLGFTRRKASWNRKVRHFVEVIDLQISKQGDTATVNAGVLDTSVHMRLRGCEPPEFVQEPICTVRARVGELIDGRDLWWQVGDCEVPARVSTAVSSRVLPFVERMRSREEMVRWLVEAQVVERMYPLPIINLAILQVLVGNTLEGCALLANLRKTAIGGWRGTAIKVAERLGCSEQRAT